MEKKKRYNVALTPTLKKQMEKVADKEKRSVSSLIEYVMDMYVSKKLA